MYWSRFSRPQNTDAVTEKSMQTTFKGERENSGRTRICASGDGTWKTRGHTSKFEVYSVIGADTVKVIHVEVLSSFCKACESNLTQIMIAKRIMLEVSAKRRLSG